MGGRHSRCEHLRSDHVWSSGRNRLLGDARSADLGLDKMDAPTKAVLPQLEMEKAFVR
jgi:hypothetical protein